MTNAKFEYMWRFLKENKRQVDDNKSDSNCDDLTCTVCKLVMINPYIGICGCRFCLECITTYLNGKAKLCPGDREECKDELLDLDENISPDNKTSHRISKLLVKCPRKFCSFEDQLRKIEEHEKCCREQSVECPYSTVGCKATQLTADTVNEHLLIENLIHTKRMMSFIDRVQNEIGSTNRDVVELLLETKHLESEKDILRKVAEQQAEDMERLRTAVQATVTQLLAEQCLARERLDSMDQIKEDMANLKNDHKLIKEENSSLKTEMEKLRAEFSRSRENGVKQLHKMEQTGDVKRLDGSHKASQCRENCEVPENPLVNGVGCMARQLQKIYLDIARQNLGEFVMSINGWSAKRDAALEGTGKPVISEPFYSHLNGYKMCLAVYPGGSGVGKDTHLSVSLHLMRGQNDDQLAWPFKLTVKMALVNQLTLGDHVSYTVSFEQFPNHCNWNRPVGHKNAGFTKSKMIELTELTGNPDLCRDDRIYIRCTVVPVAPA